MLSSVDVAVTITVPAIVGVNTPEDVIVPSDAVQVTAELYDPVPCTVAAQLDVCVVRMDAGEQTTATDVIVGVLPPPLLPPEPPPQPDTSKAIETGNVKAILLCNGILPPFESRRAYALNIAQRLTR